MTAGGVPHHSRATKSTKSSESVTSTSKHTHSTSSFTHSNSSNSSSQLLAEFDKQLRNLRNNETEILIHHLTVEAGNLATKGLVSDVTLAIRKIFNDKDVPKIRVLYLIDSIKKHFNEDLFKELIFDYLPDLFCKTFMMDVKGRMRLFKLRESWKRIFKSDFLDDIDVRVHYLDKKWPLWSEKAKEKYSKQFGNKSSSQTNKSMNESPSIDSKHESIFKAPLFSQNPTKSTNQPSSKVGKYDQRNKSSVSPTKNQSQTKFQNTTKMPQTHKKPSTSVNSHNFTNPGKQQLSQVSLVEFYEKCPHLASVVTNMKRINSEYEIVFGNEEFFFKLNDKPFTVKVDGNDYTMYIDPNSLVLYINENPVYCIFSPVIIFQGYQVFFRSLPVTIFFNSNQHDLHHNAPPQEILINGRKCYAQIRDFYLYIDTQMVSLCYEKRHKVEVYGKEYKLSFNPPPELVTIDGEKTKFVFDSYFPMKVGDDGKRYCAYFDGNDTILKINDTEHRIFLKKKNLMTIGGRKCILALGGPFYELIVNGKCYSLMFDENPIQIKVRKKMFSFALKGPSPKLSFIDLPDELYHIQINKNRHPDNHHFKNIPLLQYPDEQNTAPAALIPTNPVLQQQHQRPQPLLNSNQSSSFNKIFIQSNKQNYNDKSSSSSMGTSQIETNSIQISNLFNKLINHGLINDAKSQPHPQQQLNLPSNPINLNNTSSNNNVAAVPDLTRFDSHLMKNFFPQLLDTLYQPVKCNYCGLRFTKSQNKMYQDHSDAHFRQKQTALKKSPGKSMIQHCQVYYTAVEWIHYSSTSNLNNPNNQPELDLLNIDCDETPKLDNSIINDLLNATNVTTETHNSCTEKKNYVLLTSEQDADFCPECKDPFDHVWDQASELWAVKNAVERKGQIYHASCINND